MVVAWGLRGGGRRAPTCPTHHHHIFFFFFNHHSSRTHSFPGGYTTLQFIKYGIPLQVIQFIGTTAIFIARPHKWLFAGATVAVAAAVVLLPLAWVHLPASWRRAVVPRRLRRKTEEERRAADKLAESKA